MINNISATIISYSPTIGIFKNIDSFIDKLDKFILVYNSKRIYYMTQNRLLLSKKYSKMIPSEYNFLKISNLLFIHNITKIILYEDMKIKKLYAKIIALIYLLTHKVGKYDI